MTATDAPEEEKRREGTDDDIAGWRLHYRLADDQGDDDRWIVWMVRRGITVYEGIKVKHATSGRVSIAALQQVAVSPRMAAEDPEAFQALVWMVRRHRDGEDLKLGDLASINVLSVWQEWVDSDGVPLDIPDPQPDPELAKAAADLTAAMAEWLPHVDHAVVLGSAAALLAENQRRTPDDPGEDSAGSPNSPEPATSKSTTRKTSKRTSTSGSPN